VQGFWWAKVSVRDWTTNQFATKHEMDRIVGRGISSMSKFMHSSVVCGGLILGAILAFSSISTAGDPDYSVCGDVNDPSNKINYAGCKRCLDEGNEWNIGGAITVTGGVTSTTAGNCDRSNNNKKDNKSDCKADAKAYTDGANKMGDTTVKERLQSNVDSAQENYDNALKTAQDNADTAMENLNTEDIRHKGALKDLNVKAGQESISDQGNAQKQTASISEIQANISVLNQALATAQSTYARQQSSDDVNRLHLIASQCYRKAMGNPPVKMVPPSGGLSSAQNAGSEAGMQWNDCLAQAQEQIASSEADTQKTVAGVQAELQKAQGNLKQAQDNAALMLQDKARKAAVLNQDIADENTTYNTKRSLLVSKYGKAVQQGQQSIQTALNKLTSAQQNQMTGDPTMKNALNDMKAANLQAREDGCCADKADGSKSTNPVCSDVAKTSQTQAGLAIVKSLVSGGNVGAAAMQGLDVLGSGQQ